MSLLHIAAILVVLALAAWILFSRGSKRRDAQDSSIDPMEEEELREEILHGETATVPAVSERTPASRQRLQREGRESEPERSC
ncbi:hypothetical protein GCM10011371_18390 [Novosphingobium marinum]|uniref:Uncharacterized protein n=1 Tax=Novosphingobium marinum TaxID=1514948 RepID=A0A7Y9XWL2_9SPHN|nr:hypothetical protein [Novosphingobium marinum]GGC31278.1 hypothetical protein GCM10011371_18390 [Novosphingobium marinum]